MGSQKKKKTSPTLLPPQASFLTFFSLPAHKQHGTAVASQFVSPRLGCLQLSSLLSSRSILCFWTLSFFFFRQRVVDLVFSCLPGLNNLDAAVPLVPVLAETPSIDKAVTLLPTTSRQKRPQETKHRSSPTPKKKEVIIWHLFFFKAAKNLSNNHCYCCWRTETRYLSTSTDFSPLTPAVCTACQDLLQCGEFPSSHQNKPPFFFGSPVQSPADSEEKTLRFN